MEFSSRDRLILAHGSSPHLFPLCFSPRQGKKLQNIITLIFSSKCLSWTYSWRKQRHRSKVQFPRGSHYTDIIMVWIPSPLWNLKYDFFLGVSMVLIQVSITPSSLKPWLRSLKTKSFAVNIHMCFPNGHRFKSPFSSELKAQEIKRTHANACGDNEYCKTPDTQCRWRGSVQCTVESVTGITKMLRRDFKKYGQLVWTRRETVYLARRISRAQVGQMEISGPSSQSLHFILSDIQKYHQENKCFHYPISFLAFL